MDMEIATLLRKEVGKYIRFEDIPPGSIIASSKFELLKKCHPDCTYNKHKARLVALGKLVKRDKGFNTYAPISRDNILKMLYQISAILHWLMYQLDMICAFVHAKLPPELK